MEPQRRVKSAVHGKEGREGGTPEALKAEAPEDRQSSRRPGPTISKRVPKPRPDEEIDWTVLRAKLIAK